MTNLNSAILSFDDWPNPSSFYCIICNDKYLLTDELNLFKEIWLNASRFEFWNDGDLSVGLEKAKQFIKKNYTLTDKVIEVVVKAISYPWK